MWRGRGIQLVTEEVDVAVGPPRAGVDRAKESLSGGRRGPELRCQWAHLEGKEFLTECGFSRPPVTPGGALGAALAAWHQDGESSQTPVKQPVANKEDIMQGGLLGPAYSDDEIENTFLS